MNRLTRAVLVVFALACPWSAAFAARPSDWAQPVHVHGVPDMYQITPFVFRSAQPSAAGMRGLDELGIRTVINLCGYHDDRRLMKGTLLRELRVPIDLRQIGETEIVAVLRKLKHVKEGPFLFHCRSGNDQTALVAAMYRVAVEGWDKKRAITEMTRGGYGRGGVRRSIVNYVRHVDAARIRHLVEK
jgi:protein tyrosine/serine phosphatase